MTLANAFGKNLESVRTRSFEMGGHTFKVKVPLTSETDAMFERIKVVDDAKVQEYYDSLSKEFLDNRQKYEEDKDIEFKDDDVVVKGYSLKETAKNKIITQNRVVEMFKLLVPENKEFDMTSISYDDVDELFPFAIQMEMVDEISKVISPNYTENRKK